MLLGAIVLLVLVSCARADLWVSALNRDRAFGSSRNMWPGHSDLVAKGILHAGQSLQEIDAIVRDSGFTKLPGSRRPVAFDEATPEFDVVYRSPGDNWLCSGEWFVGVALNPEDRLKQAFAWTEASCF